MKQKSGTNVPCEETKKPQDLGMCHTLTFIYIMIPDLMALHLKCCIIRKLRKEKNKSYIVA